MIDEYSHEENPEHSQKFPDIKEIEDCINNILEIIHNKDEEHYNALCESIEISNKKFNGECNKIY